MNEGSSMMYHGNGGFGGPGQVYMVGGHGQAERQGRHYPLEMLQVMGGVGARGGSPGHATPRRWQPRRDRQKTDNTAFGYDSDDSSLSSNASGSNKSEEKGEGSRTMERVPHSHGHSHAYSHCTNSGVGSGAGAAAYLREWRPRHKQQRPQRRFAPDKYLNSTYPFQVKFTPDDLLNGSKYDTLSQEIWDKFVKSQQTEETFRKKMNLWRYLYITIKSIFPRYGLYVVGSTMSGFGLDASDMDLCLFVRAPTPTPNPLTHAHGPDQDQRAHAMLHLNYILGYIKSFDPSAELIQAKVPILKFRDARNGLQVDLNCNNVVGIRNTNLLHCFSRMDWRVRPLVALTKLWAQAHNINDARQRTLSSYSLTLMVIHFLQCGTQPAVLPRACEAGVGVGPGVGVGGGWEPRARPAPAPGSHNRTTLAELFLNMLKYYAEFPWSRMAVSVRAGGRVPVGECRAARAHKNDPHQWKLLCVEEPFDLTNTARSVYDPETFERIVETFRTSHKRLAAGLRLADAWPPR